MITILSPYHMITASIKEDEVIFESDKDYDEAIRVGFFRISTPKEIDLKAGRTFAATFTKQTRYTQFGSLDGINGYFGSNLAQTERFSLERDYWNLCSHDEEPNMPVQLQTLGKQLSDIGIIVLRTILKKQGLPELLWAKATAGASEGNGSQGLLFNCYDPKFADRAMGVGEHKDWGYVTVLDAIEPGLEAKIQDCWRSLHLEDGFLTINFGYPLQKLLGMVHASKHRVVTQQKKMRTSTVLFVDPRVGSYPSDCQYEDNEGYIYAWDEQQQKLVDEERTVEYFKRKATKLYG